MISIETYILSKKYTDKQVELFNWKLEFVETLPSEDIDTHTIYFVPMSSHDESNNYCYEYIYVNNEWEMIGSTEFKPEDYMTKEETEAYVEDHEYVLQPATANDLGGVMIDTNTMQLEANGKISIASIGADDIANLFD